MPRLNSPETSQLCYMAAFEGDRACLQDGAPAGGDDQGDDDEDDDEEGVGGDEPQQYEDEDDDEDDDEVHRVHPSVIT